MAATRRDDILRGAAGADVIDGLAGDDLIYGGPATPTPRLGVLQADRVATGLVGAVSAIAAPGRPDELFVVQKDLGRIALLDPATGAATTYLDLPAGELSTGGEQGLLGLAFHPEYAANGRFFVHLTNAAGDIEIRRYVRSTDPDRADPASGRVILTVPHPGFDNHNGGALAFGPRDGFLYVALGDGGGARDPGDDAQDTGSWLGKILRIDVDRDAFPANPGRNYGVPASNPFVGVAGQDEVWAYGLRNPWRIAFDQTTGDLYIADVGQAAREEVNVQPAGARGGANYGWNRAEGTLGEAPPGAVDPVFEYGRGLGRSITGGEVYRGDEPSLRGAYLFTDFISGEVWAMRRGAGAATVERITDQVRSPEAPLVQITSFGRDGAGGLYAVSLGGDVFRLDPVAAPTDRGDLLSGGAGADAIFGGVGNDALFGGAGADRLYGQDDHDRISGENGADRMSGGAGVDRLNGGAHGDAVSGGLGGDLLLGGPGRDTLAGGPGRDRLLGGADADVFLFRRGDGADRVYDFAAGDRLDLRALDLPGFGAVAAATRAVGGEALIDLAGWGGGEILLNGVAPGELGPADVLL